jgi:hypothetical protein
MLSTSFKAQLALQCLTGAVYAQSAGSAARTTYGNNALAIDLDNEAVSRNYHYCLQHSSTLNQCQPPSVMVPQARHRMPNWVSELHRSSILQALQLRMLL